jgi:hypothetical protein
MPKYPISSMTAQGTEHRALDNMGLLGFFYWQNHLERANQ